MKEFRFFNAVYDEKACRISTRMVQSQLSQSPGFIFVNVSNTRDEKKRKHMQKVVRSAATAYSHRVQPRGASKSEVTLKLLRTDSRNVVPEQLISKRSDDTHNGRSSNAVKQKTTANVANISRKRDVLIPKHRRSDIRLAQKERSLSPGPVNLWVPDPSFLDASMKDPFNSYPVHYRRWYGQLINFVSRRCQRIARDYSI